MIIISLEWKMNRTLRDLNKIKDATLSVGKTVIYYGYIPLIVVLGMRTMNKEMLFGGQPPMWMILIVCSMSHLSYQLF